MHIIRAVYPNRRLFFHLGPLHTKKKRRRKYTSVVVGMHWLYFGCTTACYYDFTKYGIETHTITHIKHINTHIHTQNCKWVTRKEQKQTFINFRWKKKNHIHVSLRCGRACLCECACLNSGVRQRQNTLHILNVYIYYPSLLHTFYITVVLVFLLPSSSFLSSSLFFNVRILVSTVSVSWSNRHTTYVLCIK